MTIDKDRDGGIMNSDFIIGIAEKHEQTLPVNINDMHINNKIYAPSSDDIKSLKKAIKQKKRRNND